MSEESLWAPPPVSGPPSGTSSEAVSQTMQSSTPSGNTSEELRRLVGEEARKLKADLEAGKITKEEFLEKKLEAVRNAGRRLEGEDPSVVKGSESLE
eukprot:CAMPEP_0178428136 /NCGR_PEP_ID=MMETSP0689_2-20121128/30115_1 /TAXON_ID=160604 /ORGANISM="Amphidinium massartii, Strain CS-259" /LENGTH=96 /DNA_ID=CAMNT_0020049885 /DNA_START=34 /DNA_END=324 /DNA_ORIENTATION=+